MVAKRHAVFVSGEIRVSAVKQGCVGLRNALQCTSDALSTVVQSRFADRETAVTTVMASAVQCSDL